MILFDDVNTLEELKIKYIDSQFPSEIKSRILCCDNSEELNNQIVNWLNNLFNEYNQKIKLTSNISEYDNILYNAIIECIPFVSIKHSIILKTNLCILSDDENNKSLHRFFIDNIKNANIDADKLLSIPTLDNIPDEKVLSVLGFLNFRAHNYNKSQIYLNNCTQKLSSLIEKNKATLDQKLHFISATIFLASCLEYEASTAKGDNRKSTLTNAITKLLGYDCTFLEDSINQNYVEIIEKIESFYRNNHYIESSEQDQYTQIIDFVDNMCFGLPKTSTVISHSIILGFNDENIKKLRNEYFHVLAHCLSEYAAVLRESNNTPYPLCSILQMLSRFFLDWLVSHGNDDYATCQATVRAENDATPEAIELLLKQISSIDNPNTADEKKKYAELQFFIYYLAEQELRLAYDNEQMLHTFSTYGNEFLNYAKAESENGNNDPLFHYYIVYFRYLLKQAANHMIAKLPNDAIYSERVKLNQTYNELISVEKKISAHVLKPIRDEFQKLQRLYLLYNQIKSIDSNYILSSSASEEFETLLRFYNPSLPNDIDYNTEMRQLYNEMLEAQNILLLAPVPNAPSCSFSIENIDELIPLHPITSSVSTINCSKFVKEQIRKLDQMRIDTVLDISVKDEVKERLKWVIYFDSSKLFLYYSDFFPSKEFRMFPVIMNQNERKQCISVFSDLVTMINNSDSIVTKKCNNPTKNCENNQFDICYASIFHVTNKDFYEKLFEILVFLEFDFQKYDARTKKYTPRIENDDIVVVYHKRNETEYRIMGFSQFDILKVRNQLCNICEFRFYEKDKFIKNDTQAENPYNKPLRCEMLNFSKQLSILEQRLLSFRNTRAQLYKETQILISMVKSCQTCCKCPYPESKTDHTCKLINEINEKQLEIAYGKKFNKVE